MFGTLALVSDIPIMVSTIKDLCHLLARGLPNGFPFFWFLGFVHPKAPIRDGVPRPTGNVPN